LCCTPRCCAGLQDYVIAQFPHGAFPLGALLGGTFMATEFPLYHCYETAASSAFLVPIWRHVHAWLGTEVCTKSNFHGLLSMGVKGPLPHHSHHRSHHRSSEQEHEQQQQQEGEGEGEPQQLSTSLSRGSPFAAAKGAAAVASDDGAGNLGAPAKLSLLRRHSGEHGLHGQRRGLLSPLSITASIRARFRRHHSLSDTESSDSESECEPGRVSQASDASSACSERSQQPLSPQLRGHCSAPVRLGGLRSSGSHRLGHHAAAAPAPAGAADALPPPEGGEQQSGCAWRVDPATGQRKTGVAIGLMVGGIAEMFMIRRDHERVKLRDRKGFVRIALEHGVPILPVYMFGANQVLDFGPPWLQRISRRMRASVGMIYGIWGLPVPRRLPIFKVTGAPMPVGPAMRKDHPDFARRVDELHAQFITELERVYYTHRGKYGHGFENRPLVIS
jgi:hypothetical protein